MELFKHFQVFRLLLGNFFEKPFTEKILSFFRMFDIEIMFRLFILSGLSPGRLCVPS